jgi:hypothetical protein
MTNQEPAMQQQVEKGERIVSVSLLLAPLLLRLVARPSMPVLGDGNGIVYHLAALVSSGVMLTLALSRLTKRLRGRDGGSIMGFAVLTVVSLLPALYFLSWAVGLYAWVMVIPYCLLAISLLMQPVSPRFPFT